MSLRGVNGAEVSRQKGQKIQSLGTLAFAIHNVGSMAVVPASSNGNVLFSDEGAGVYPIAIYGYWKDVQDTLMKYRDVSVESRVGGGDEAFTVKTRVAWAKEAPTVEIHDAGKEIQKNVASFLGGVGASAVSAGGVASTVNDIGGAAADIYDISQTLGVSMPRSGDLLKKLKSKKVAVWIHYLGGPGWLDTGQHTISFGDILAYAAACTANLGR